MLNRRSLIGFGLAALATAARAQPAGDPAVATVQTLYDSYQNALKEGGDVKARAAVITEPMKAAFDFPAMLRIAVGAPWQGFPEGRRVELADAFGRYLTLSYANRLSSAKGGKFEVDPKSEARSGGSKLVRTKVTSASGDADTIDFILSAGNRIADVLLQGTISEVATFRSNFTDPVKSGGPDGLLKYLQQQSEPMLKTK